jgi:CheY-like chemotaxis protein
MPIILIADSCKPSLVMSSEVFKDKITGATIIVASTGRQALEALQTHKPDMCVVDFDLPDVDGVTLIAAIRKTYRGPILLTAYPDKIVEQAVTSDLFAWGDAGAWIPKPVKFDILSEKIDQFLLDKHRLGKRFDLSLDTMIIGKGAGRGKRAPKVTGRITNLSLGGACIELDEPMRMKGGEEMLVALSLPSEDGKSKLQIKAVLPKGPKAPKGRVAATAKKAKVKDIPDARIKCTVAWIDKRCTKAGIQFARLTDIQKKGLEEILRSALATPA